jgi:DNA polymerase
MTVLARHVVHLSAPDDVDGWRAGVRPLLAARVPLAVVEFAVAGAQTSLFADGGASPPTAKSTVNLPAAFWPLARTALLHRDEERHAIHYELALKLADHGVSLADHAHPLVRRVEVLATSVRRDIHKMRAFVRFREVAEPDGGTRFVAWFEPDHHIVRTNARFFVERFASMRWSILTPALCIHWDGQRLTESAGATRGDAPAGDPVEDIWKRYYASIFNPARVKIGAMLSEMPRKYWHNMPETALIPELIAGAQQRTRQMLDRGKGHCQPLAIPHEPR